MGRVIALTIAFLLIASTAFADSVILNLTRAGFSLRISAKDGTTIVQAKVSGSHKSSVEAVESPPRLALDFRGAKLGFSRTIKLPEGGALKRVRIGNHPDKLRIVVDFASEKIPHFTTKATNSDVTITFASDATLSTTPSPTITSSETAVASVPPSETPSPTPTVDTPTPIATEAATVPTKKPTAAPTAKPSPKPTPQHVKTTTTSTTSTTTSTSTTTTFPLQDTPGERIKAWTSSGEIAVEPGLGPTSVATLTPVPTADLSGKLAPKPTFLLKKIYFDRSNGSKLKLVKIECSGHPGFELARQSEKEYQITIESCGLSSEKLSLVQFPPQDFAGLTSVLASEKDGVVTIKIGVESGVRLNAFAKEDSIWVMRAEG